MMKGWCLELDSRAEVLERRGGYLKREIKEGITVFAP